MKRGGYQTHPLLRVNATQERTFYKNKVILVIGGTGSWGQELVRQLLAEEPREVRVMSRGEHAQVNMMRRFSDFPQLSFYLGDVRDLNRVMEVMQGVDIVFHLAALKHVPICERHIWETVQTNVMGTQNVVEAVRINEVERAIYISSDKAVEPINLYGHTKAISEKIFITANAFPKSKTLFSCIRAGNVLGTQGSVVPLFREQIERHNKVTLTDDRMTRFLVPVPEMISFLVRVSAEAKGGEIFVPKMPAVRIVELAQVMMTTLGNRRTKMEAVGIRPAEKIHELLVSHDEISRTIEFQNYFVIMPYDFILEKLPQLQTYFTQGERVQDLAYSSATAIHLNDKQISQFLRKNGYLSRVA